MGIFKTFFIGVFISLFFVSCQDESAFYEKKELQDEKFKQFDFDIPNKDSQERPKGTDEQDLPKKDGPKVDGPKVDEPKVDEPKVDEPKVDEPKVDEPKVDEPKVDEPKVDEPKVDEPKVDEPKVDEPKVDEPKVDEPKVDEPKVDEPKVDEPKVDEPKVDEPKVDEPKVDEPKVDEPKVDEPKVDEPKVDEPKVDEPTISEEQMEQMFKQNNESKGKVDILWVIDNSGSMGDEQENLATNFEAFIERFLENDVDFHMGVTTTDATNGRLGQDIQGARNKLTSEHAKKNEDKFIKDFKSIVKVGTKGSSVEKGLLAAESYLTKKEHLEKFFREDAYLILVVLSDEKEQSDKSAQHYVDFFWSLKGGNKGLVKVYSVVTTKVESYSYYYGGRLKTVRNDSMIGLKYMEAAKLTNGKTHDIKEDFYTILTNMGGNIVDLVDSFALNEVPNDTARIDVYVNGQMANDWEYNAETNSIKFLEGSVPAAGSMIKVVYFKNL